MTASPAAEAVAAAGNAALPTLAERDPEQLAAEAAEAMEALAEHIAHRVTEQLAPGMVSGTLPAFAAEQLAHIPSGFIGSAVLIRSSFTDLGAEVVTTADGLQLALWINGQRIWSAVLRLDQAAAPAACGYVHE